MSKWMWELINDWTNESMKESSFSEWIMKWVSECVMR